MENEYKEVAKDIIDMVCEYVLFGESTDEELEEKVALLIECNQISKVARLEREVKRLTTIVSN